MPAFLPLLLPVAVLLLPLLDFGLAVVRRLAAGKSPFSADRKHLHHRLQDLGHTHLGSVLVFYFWSISVSCTALLLFLTTIETALLFGVVAICASMIYTLWPVLKRRRARVA